MADDLKTRIEEAADGPAEAQAKGERVRDRTIDELIKADKHLQGEGAKRRTRTAFRVNRFRPGGTT